MGLSDFVVWFTNLDPHISSWISYATYLRPPVRVIGGLLLTLTVVFIFFFLLRGIWLRLKLARLLQRLRKTKSTTDDFTKLFSLDKMLAHLWREYRHTLHEQRDVNPQTGSQEVIALRATVPAETFFDG